MAAATRVPPARHIPSTEVALNFGRVTADFCMSECSPGQLIRIFRLRCPPEVSIWSAKLNDSTSYICFTANATCSFLRESSSAMNAAGTKATGHRHDTKRSTCIAYLGTQRCTPTSSLQWRCFAALSTCEVHKVFV